MQVAEETLCLKQLLMRAPLDDLAVVDNNGFIGVADGASKDNLEDQSLPIWAGVLPIKQAIGKPIRADYTDGSISIPDYVTNCVMKKFSNIEKMKTAPQRGPRVRFAMRTSYLTLGSSCQSLLLWLDGEAVPALVAELVETQRKYPVKITRDEPQTVGCLSQENIKSEGRKICA